MSISVTCPRCHTEVEVTEVMRSQLMGEIRDELQGEAALAKAEIDDARRAVEEDRAAIARARQNIDDELRNRLEAQREQLKLEARRLAEEGVAVDLHDREQQLQELRLKLKTAQDAELAIRKRERELQAKAEEVELEVSRTLEVERDKIRTDALRHFAQEHQLKDAEKEKQIGDLRRQIDDLKRKAEQGSQQLQGEVQELALEDLLRTAFPADNVAPVAKGVCGGDSMHQVLDATGLLCGAILWESKRTKNWSHGWLAKLRDDQRTARAACAVIVSEALPDGVDTFAMVDGVWVCSWTCVRPLATALRVGLIELAKSRLAVQGQHDKMEMVYNYLASQEFRNRVAGIVEAFLTMRQDLESEKRSMQRLWSKREKQLDRAMMNTAGMYGELQGIIGASLPAISGLAISCIEYQDDESVELHDGTGEFAN